MKTYRLESTSNPIDVIMNVFGNMLSALRVCEQYTPIKQVALYVTLQIFCSN